MVLAYGFYGCYSARALEMQFYVWKNKQAGLYLLLGVTGGEGALATTTVAAVSAQMFDELTWMLGLSAIEPAIRPGAMFKLAEAALRAA